MTTRTLTASTLLATFLLTGIALADDEGSSSSSSSSSSSTSSSEKRKNTKTIDLPCVQEIVRKRDDAIIAALGTYTTSLTSVFSARRDALVSAWGMENRKERKKAITAAWKAFREGKKTAERVFREARKAAWKTFNADRKTCRGSPDEMRDANQGE